jgi:glutamate 5-kinase
MSAGKTTAASTPLTQARRLVVKVGSTLLVDGRTGRLNRAWLKTLIADLLRLHRRGQQVILVSSGAIALGRRQLQLPAGTLRLEESQAAAAVGQIRLAHAYKELLEEGGVNVAQVLLTLEDSEQRTRYLNARATLEALLSLNAIPVINENDTVATAEIRYGDNDRLAARVAQMASADCLVLLSDVDGLYSADPNRDPNARFIERVLRVTPEIEAMAGKAWSDFGSGGMATKIMAGAHCGQCRVPHVHCRGTSSSPDPAHRERRALQLVCADLHAAGGAQAMDRRHAAAGRGAAHRRRSVARTAQRQEPAAGRSDRNAGSLSTRATRSACSRPTAAKSRAALPPTPTAMPRASWAERAAKSPRCWDFAAARS